MNEEVRSQLTDKEVLIDLVLSLSVSLCTLEGDCSKSQMQLLLYVDLNETFYFTVFIPRSNVL